MSTDVYIDFWAHGSETKTVRIGYLFVVTCGPFDFLGALRALIVASDGVVAQWVPGAASRLCRELTDRIEKERREEGPDWLNDRYGSGVDWDDRLDPGRIAEEFAACLGWRWDERVD